MDPEEGLQESLLPVVGRSCEGTSMEVNSHGIGLAAMCSLTWGLKEPSRKRAPVVSHITAQGCVSHITILVARECEFARAETMGLRCLLAFLSV